LEVPKGMSSRKNTANSISRTAKLGLVGLALVLSLLSVNKAEAKDIEGYVAVDYYISGVGGASSGLNFIKGASTGLDILDSLYDEIPSPDDAHVKAVGSVEGREADGIADPPLQDVAGSSGGASFSGSIVVRHGKSVILDNAEHYLSAWTNLQGCKVTVNGVDISETSHIPLGTLSGTFGPGEHGTASFSINVEYIGPGGGNGGDPNEPEPPEPNVPLDAGPHILRIDNVHEKMSTKTFRLVYKLGATDGPNDSGDVAYTLFSGVLPPFIVSQVGDKYLTVDNRDTSSRSQIFLKQMAYSDYGFSRVSGGDTNALVFSFPADEGINNKFGNRILAFQEYIRDANEPNLPTQEPNAPKVFPDPNAETFPVYLIRELIADGNGFGVVTLPNFSTRIYNGTLHSFIIRTDALTKELAVGDFNRDGRVDVNDCNAVERAMAYTVNTGNFRNSVYDIASCDVNDPNVLRIGIDPDGIVNGTDKKAIYQLMEQDKKRREDINKRKETSDEIVGE
jgi:hypothetical protein